MNISNKGEQYNNLIHPILVITVSIMILTFIKRINVFGEYIKNLYKILINVMLR